jgi:tyrosine-protein phosphatase OCA6
MTNGTSDFYFPPFRFAAVEDNVFRGALPKPRNLSFISTLNLTTLIACIPEPMPDHISEFADHNNISLVFFKTEKPKEHIPLSFPKVLQILQLLCDSTQIIYLHCLDGVLVTSMIIMGLRKLQGWSSDAYMNEACRFLRDGNFTFKV